jgi:hypothetical protein
VVAMGGEQAAGFGGLTPAAARAKIAELRKDKTWVDGWTNGDKTKRDEMNRLVVIAAGS